MHLMDEFRTYVVNVALVIMGVTRVTILRISHRFTIVESHETVYSSAKLVEDRSRMTHKPPPTRGRYRHTRE